MRRLLPPVVIMLLVATLYLTGSLEFVEHHLMDLRFRMDERQASGDVVIVQIDSRSLNTLDVWPWARGYHATLLENLVQAGAQRIGFDVDFSSRSDPDEDLELERALAASAGRVVLPSFEQYQREREEVLRRTTQPLATFSRHTRLGSINIQPDSDGLVREYYLRGDAQGEPTPSFAATLAGHLASHNDRFLIDYSIDYHSIPTLSYVDVLTGQFDAGDVRGKAVIIGATAAEMNDHVAVPLHNVMPGPVLQALAFESLKQGRALDRASAPFTLAIMVLLTLLLNPLMNAASWRQGLGLLAVVAAGSFFISFAMQKEAAQMIDVSPWMLVGLCSYAAAMFHRVEQQGLTLLLQGMRLQHTETLMSHVVESSFDAIIMVREGGTIEMFNAAAANMFGYSASEAQGRPVGELVQAVGVDRGNEDAPEPADSSSLWQRDGQQEVVGLCHDGSKLPLEISISAIQGDEQHRKIGILRDISERKAQQAALMHQATHDHLTNLPNRVLLRRRFDKSLRVARENGWSIAFLLLDLDGFREINDTLGHHVGDQLLQQIGRRLQVPLDRSATIARLGGDEFAILLPKTSLAGAKKVAERICQGLVEPFVVRKLKLQISTSIGITLFPEHGLDSTELIQRADVAMYAAKDRRSGISVYDPEQDYNSVRHLTLNGDLRKAIDKDQLFLHYQPKVSIKTGRVLSVEALARWEHPEHGMLPPDEFIGLAEHSGLIRALTRWVLSKALYQYVVWRNAGLDIAMAVNLSARNLQEKDLPQTLHDLLESYRVPPNRLILEITETVLMEDPENTLKILRALGDLGVRISIDDFGTGYSSLSYLKKLPADELKIDRSFVMALDSDEDDAVIVRSTIDMAHNLGLKVVAEGVETTEIWDQLKCLGCDYGQGYLWGRPMLGSDLEQILLKNSGQSITPIGDAEIENTVDSIIGAFSGANTI